MRILLTGVTGYVGKRLLPVLVEQGHQIICCVREKNRLNLHKNLLEKLEVIEIDFLDEPITDLIPKNIDAAYYLIHSMTTSSEGWLSFSVFSFDCESVTMISLHVPF